MDLPVFNRRVEPAVEVPSLCHANATPILHSSFTSAPSTATAADAKADEDVSLDIEEGVKKQLRVLVVDDSSANRSGHNSLFCFLVDDLLIHTCMYTSHPYAFILQEDSATHARKTRTCVFLGSVRSD